jgi:hypothetical protein
VNCLFNKVLAKRTGGVFLLFVIVFVKLNTLAQSELKPWKQSILLESSVVEVFSLSDDIGDYFNLKYCGQSIRYSLERNVSEKYAIGLETGLFTHVRSGDMHVVFHHYIPLMLNNRLYGKNRRFNMCFSVGFPIMLTNKYNYIGSAGLWYRNQLKDPTAEDQGFIDSQYYLRDRFDLLSALRFNFALRKLPNTALHFGLQNYIFSYHNYQAGEPNVSKDVKEGFAFNLIGGISWDF